MRILVDTNILIDFVCHRDGFYEPARNVFATAFAGKNEVLLTDLSYMNCIYVAKHYGVDSATLLDALRAIQKVCSMADINDDVMSSVLTFSLQIYKQEKYIEFKPLKPSRLVFAKALTLRNRNTRSILYSTTIRRHQNENLSFDSCGLLFYIPYCLLIQYVRKRS